MAHHPKTAAVNARSLHFLKWLPLAIAALALYAVLPRIHGLAGGWQALEQGSKSDLVLALLAMLLTYPFAALTYRLLAFRHLHYWLTVRVQVASLFAGKLLPAGLGALGLSYVYLRKHRHNNLQGIAVVSANNLLGVLGHLSVLAILLLLDPSPLSLGVPVRYQGPLLVAVAVVLGLLFLARHRLNKLLSKVWRAVVPYRRQPHRLVAAWVSSMFLTVCYISSFWLCLHALGIGLSPVQTALVFTLGVGAGTAAPTPGGLGGAEAGLVAGLAAYGVQANIALAGVLAYRFITFWLPFVFGGLMFALLRRQDAI